MSEHGIKTDSDKTRCIADWPTPSCLQDLKQSLGFVTRRLTSRLYYRRFRNFAAIVAPLVKLTEKGHVWHWSSDCDAAFFTVEGTPGSISHIVFNQPFMVDTDASGRGLGLFCHSIYRVWNVSLLLQAGPCLTLKGSTVLQGVTCLLYQTFLPLSIWQTFYSADRLHCGGCRVFMNQRVKLLDGSNAFLNMRWFIALVLSIPTLMPCPVCLALSVSYHFRRFVRCNRISGCHVGLWTNLLRNKDRTPALGKLFNGWKMIVSLGYFRSTCLRIPKHCGLSLHIWFLQNGVLYRRWKDVHCKGLHRRLQLVLPPTLVPVLLEALHSSIRGGNFGTSKTLAKVCERFYWVGQRKDVAAWCSGCLSCTV